jgi:hypothetical protein
VKAGRDAAGLDRRIAAVESFVGARATAAEGGDPGELVGVCRRLLEEGLDGAVQAGDLLAILVEFHYSLGEHAAAHRMVEEMRRRRIPTGPYLDPGMLQAIRREVGLPAAGGGGGGGRGGGEEDDGGGVDEDIDEEV